jgi:hypothetical protein
LRDADPRRSKRDDPIRIFRDTWKIEVQDKDFGDGEVVEEQVVSFRLNPGPGSGRQTIPARELSAVIEVLTDALEGDVDETIPVRDGDLGGDNYVPSHAVLARTICRSPTGTLKEEYAGRDKSTKIRVVVDPNSPMEVLLRTKTGSGCKASHLPLDRLQELIDWLRVLRQRLDDSDANARNDFSERLKVSKDRDVAKSKPTAE